jgi:hypothetical protein
MGVSGDIRPLIDFNDTTKALEATTLFMKTRFAVNKSRYVKVVNTIKW